MKVTSISFMTVMIRAALAGIKTQTRRTVKNPDYFGCLTGDCPHQTQAECDAALKVQCPYGQVGDLLTVKEAVYLWCERRPNGATPTGRPKWLYVPMREAPIHYAADGPKPTTDIVSPDTGNVWMWKHKVARFLPRWASRLTLRITDVRVQRLQDISHEDALAEGCRGRSYEQDDGAPWCKVCRTTGWVRNSCGGETECGCVDGGVREFRCLWESINRFGSWEENPWVWALTFEVIKANVDTVLP